MAEKVDMKQVEKEVKQRLEEFDKLKSDVTPDELIAEDKADFKELIQSQDTLQQMVVELLKISKELSTENQKLREYLQNTKDKMMADYYRGKLKNTGMLNTP